MSFGDSFGEKHLKEEGGGKKGTHVEEIFAGKWKRATNPLTLKFGKRIAKKGGGGEGEEGGKRQG